LLAAAIGACIHPGIGLAGATKLLHLKRPRLVPILDQLAASQFSMRSAGVAVSLNGSAAGKLRGRRLRRLALISRCALPPTSPGHF
jgi:hypothetical protein